MSVGELLKQIESIDKKSDEFHKLVLAVNERYFDFESPDEYQKAAAYVHLILFGAEPWLLCLIVRLAAQLLDVVEASRPAAHGTFHVKNKEVFFDFYTDKKQLGKLHSLLRETVVATANTGDEQ